MKCVHFNLADIAITRGTALVKQYIEDIEGKWQHELNREKEKKTYLKDAWISQIRINA